MIMKRLFSFSLLVCLLGGAFSPGSAQQKIGYFDSDRVLERMPEYQTMQQEVSRMVSERQQEVDDAYAEVEVMSTEFSARELLLTEEERASQLQEIRAAEQEAEALRRRYFGAEGEVFSEQRQRLQPIQAQILEAVAEIAEERDFDYIFDRSGDYLFLYASAQYDVTEDVMDKLGIGIGENVMTQEGDTPETPTPTPPTEQPGLPEENPTREPLSEPGNLEEPKIPN